MQEFIGNYIMMEEYFMRQMVVKVRTLVQQIMTIEAQHVFRVPTDLENQGLKLIYSRGIKVSTFFQAQGVEN